MAEFVVINNGKNAKAVVEPAAKAVPVVAEQGNVHARAAKAKAC